MVNRAKKTTVCGGSLVADFDHLVQIPLICQWGLYYTWRLTLGFKICFRVAGRKYDGLPGRYRKERDGE